MVTGSCLCGQVAWEVHGKFDSLTHCHCSICRKAHGSAFGSYAAASPDGFRYVRGEDGIRKYESSPGALRPFCGRCGSVLPSQIGDLLFVAAGTLDGDPGVRLGQHFFVGSKAPWHEIRDSATRFEAFPPGVGEAVPTKRHTEPAPGKVRGACLCGRVAYECDAPLTGGVVVSCHCQRCRKARGSEHASNTMVDLASFRWLRGESELSTWKVPEAQRFRQTFCSHCGSPMPVAQPQFGRAVIPAGSFEDDPGVREAFHIFVDSKAPWEVIEGPLPQHAEYPPPPFPPVARAKA